MPPPAYPLAQVSAKNEVFDATEGRRRSGAPRGSGAAVRARNHVAVVVEAGLRHVRRVAGVGLRRRLGPLPLLCLAGRPLFVAERLRGAARDSDGQQRDEQTSSGERELHRRGLLDGNSPRGRRKKSKYPLRTRPVNAWFPAGPAPQRGAKISSTSSSI